MVAVRVERCPGRRVPVGPAEYVETPGWSPRHLRLVDTTAAPEAVEAVVSPVSGRRRGRRVEPRAVIAGRSARIYRRRRSVAMSGLIVLLAGAWFALQAAVGGAGGGLLTSTGAPIGTPAGARTWVVQPGDTLWGIALATGVRGDIRPFVDRLAAQTHGRPLTVGERIEVP